jgi:hypothetical protein
VIGAPYGRGTGIDSQGDGISTLSTVDADSDASPRSDGIGVLLGTGHADGMSLSEQISATDPATSSAAGRTVLEVLGRVAAPRISVLIPALNEAKNLPHVLGELPDIVWEVILVDGGSDDGTVEVTRAVCPKARILNQTLPGKGQALALGFGACRGDIIVMLDADGSANPQEIPKFVATLLDGTDFAKGTRFGLGGGSDDISWFRRLGNHGLVALVNLLFDTHYSDLCYGLNAFWRHCLPVIEVECDGFEVEAFINLRLAKSSLKVREVGSFERRRMHGTSKLHTVRDGFRVLRTILRERRPAARYGQAGVAVGRDTWPGGEARDSQPTLEPPRSDPEGFGYRGSGINPGRPPDQGVCPGKPQGPHSSHRPCLVGQPYVATDLASRYDETRLQITQVEARTAVPPTPEDSRQPRL